MSSKPREHKQICESSYMGAGASIGHLVYTRVQDIEDAKVSKTQFLSSGASEGSGAGGLPCTTAWECVHVDTVRGSAK